MLDVMMALRTRLCGTGLPGNLRHSFLKSAATHASRTPRAYRWRLACGFHAQNQSLNVCAETFACVSGRIQRFSTGVPKREAEDDPPKDQLEENAEEAEAIDLAIGALLPPLKAGWHPDTSKIEQAESSEKATSQLSFNQQVIDKIRNDFESYDVVRLLNVLFDMTVYLRALVDARDKLGKSKQMSPSLLTLYDQMETQFGTTRATLENIRTQLQQTAPNAGYYIFQIGPRLHPGLRPRYYAGITIFVGGSAILFYGIWKGLGAILGLGARSAEGQDS